MNGLYALKPWYADRLAGLRRGLIRRHVSPNTLTVTGVGFRCRGRCRDRADSGRADRRPSRSRRCSPHASRCANLDGAVARETRACSPGSGSSPTNSATGWPNSPRWPASWLWPHRVGWRWRRSPARCPSWVALAGTAAGANRVQGGPVGKTERAALLVVLAATGWTAADPRRSTAPDRWSPRWCVPRASIGHCHDRRARHRPVRRRRAVGGWHRGLRVAPPGTDPALVDMGADGAGRRWRAAARHSGRGRARAGSGGRGRVRVRPPGPAHPRRPVGC